VAGELSPEVIAAITEAIAAGMASLPLAAPPAVTPLVIETTPILGLAKPQYDEAADIQVLNGNMDILDHSITADGGATLTNKTLVAPVITNPTITGWTNAQHTHLDAAGAGPLDGAAIVSGDTGTGLVVRETYVGAQISLALTGGGVDLVSPDLIDPVVRDTLWWGPAPTGAPDISLKRTAAGKLRLDNHLGVGGNPVAWGATTRAVQVGAAAVLASDSSAPTRLDLGSNTYHNGTTRKAIVAGLGALFRMEAGVLTYDTAPTAAADADQSYVNRITIDAVGRVGVGRVPSAWPTQWGLVQPGILSVYGGLTSNSSGMRANSFYDGTNNVALLATASPAVDVSLASGVFSVLFAPAVVAGATQTFTSRFSVDGNGSGTLDQVNTSLALQIVGRDAVGQKGGLVLKGDGRVECYYNTTSVPPINVVGVYAHAGGARQQGLIEYVHSPTSIMIGRDYGFGTTGVQISSNSVYQNGSTGAETTFGLNTQQGNANLIWQYQGASKVAIFSGVRYWQLYSYLTGAVVQTLDASINTTTFNAIVNNWSIIAGGTYPLYMPNIGAGTYFRASGDNYPTWFSPSYCLFDVASQLVGPNTTNFVNCGNPSRQWNGIYSYYGTLNPSTVDVKSDIAALDPEACAAAVLDTQWWSYSLAELPEPDFKALLDGPDLPSTRGADADTRLPMAGEDAGMTREQRQEQTKAIMADRARVLPHRHQKGYVLGSADHKVSDLFGLPDRKYASPGSDLAVVACALQNALGRIAELEAKMAAAA